MFTPWHRPLMLSAHFCLALLLVSAVGLVVDERLVGNDPVWLKPAKFSLSIMVHNVTLAWLISLLDRGRRTAWWLGTVMAAMGAGEMVLLVTQALRGRMSHFNNATPLDATIYAVMGVLIMVLWVAALALGVILMVQRVRERSTTWALRVGVGISLLGMGVGPLMTSPTPEQDPGVSDVIGAHTVGLPDGGPGLPVLGWSTVGGDLRVGHFVGIHGLQVMILLALLLVALGAWDPRLRDDGTRLRLVAVVGAAYTGLMALAVWQALRGQSVVAPDALTLTVAGVLAALTLLGVAWSLRVSSGPSRKGRGCDSSSTCMTSSTRASASTRP